MQNKYTETIKPALILTVICAAVAFAVAVTDFITADTIKKQDEEKAEASRKTVLSSAETFTDVSSDEFTAFLGKDANGNDVGYTVITEAKGYGGIIRIMTGFDLNGTVTGVSILSEEETQGLGKNANKEEFRKQYIGKDVQSYTVVKNGASAPEEIEAITGATITTKAVTEAVNEAKQICMAIKARS